MTADSARPDLVGATGGSLAEEQFRLAVEACPNGMVMTDRDGKIARVTTYYNLTDWIAQVSG